MRECRCEVPLPSPNPRRAGWCNKCSGYIDPRWTSNDATVNEFMDRLAETFAGAPSPAFYDFRLHCEGRERAGRSRFGHSHLGRDNVREGHEEAADGALYSMFEVLQNRRAGDDEQWDMALIAAHHFAKAYEALSAMRSKEKGQP